MKYRSALFHSCLFFLAFFAAFFLFFPAVCTAEDPLFYTIQAGSFAGEQGGLHLYQDIAGILPESQRAYLRVEKVGSYYTVRLGKLLI